MSISNLTQFDYFLYEVQTHSDIHIYIAQVGENDTFIDKCNITQGINMVIGGKYVIYDLEYRNEYKFLTQIYTTNIDEIKYTYPELFI